MPILNEYVTVDKETAAGVPVLTGFPTVTRQQAEGVIEQAAAKFISEVAA